MVVVKELSVLTHFQQGTVYGREGTRRKVMSDGILEFCFYT